MLVWVGGGVSSGLEVVVLEVVVLLLVGFEKIEMRVFHRHLPIFRVLPGLSWGWQFGHVLCNSFL
jgi:hypothetical protein